MTKRLLVLALVAFAAACGDDPYDGAVPVPAPPADETVPAESTPPSTGADAGADGVIEVPAEIDTIQGAVDAAAPGDLVLISPGTYHEAVDVTTPDLTIRGLDRDAVILDGEFTLENGLRVFDVGGVAVENMTAQNYAVNGFFWTGVEGYRGSYLTALRNGNYGVYAFNSTKGVLEHSYAAGSPDAGFYIGQCYPCDAVVDDVISEHNGLGYSGANAGGNLIIVNSTFRNNRVGVVPSSGSYELCYPQRDTTIVGNRVYANSQPDTPAIDIALTAMGNGIVVAGGIDNVVERNLVYDHDLYGILLVTLPEDGASDEVPPPDEWDRTCAETLDDPPGPAIESTIFWEPYDNRVVDNVVSDNRLGDLGAAIVTIDPTTAGNCFAGNSFTSSAPAALETLAPCAGVGSGDWTASPVDLAALTERERPDAVPYDEAPLPDPPELPGMPDAASAPARPATDVPTPVDLDAIAVPAAP